MEKDKIMNTCECDILRYLFAKPYTNQRDIAESISYSVGSVNRGIHHLMVLGYLNEEMQLTVAAHQRIKETSPKRAILLAAGYGMRMVPINMETPKAFLEIKGQTLIERLIDQLHEVGIFDITIVVGFMKERFEYLIDTYGVRLVVNSNYASKNNLHSLALCAKNLDNCYILPCDIWCRSNPFVKCELDAWYMVTNSFDEISTVRVNRKKELVGSSSDFKGNRMIGISYVTSEVAKELAETIGKMDSDPRYDDAFWEEALMREKRMLVNAKVVSEGSVVEINTYEQLRELDSNSKQLQSDAIAVIAQVLNVAPEQIEQIDVLKKGMTNRSFLFTCKGEKYIMRIPGEGTDQLINRSQEAAVYTAIHGKGMCDDPVYLNPQNGYKITRYIENVRCCDANNEADLKICMKKLRSFHELGLKVDHEFDIFEKIDFYESLWNGAPSLYKDYIETKKRVLSIKSFIDQKVSVKVLTHIDAVPDNFLFDPNGKINVQLTDWEYAGMQDPHVDIAMFCIYAMYEREQIDHLIDLYFDNECSSDNRVKIYSYIAACGLLWSNWCEYKHRLGVEFGEYSLRQYRFAKEYSRIVEQLVPEL